MSRSLCRFLRPYACHTKRPRLHLAVSVRHISTETPSAAEFSPVLRDALKSLNYDPSREIGGADTQRLIDAMETKFKFKRWRPDAAKLNRWVHGAAAAADMWYPGHPYETKEYIATAIALYGTLEDAFQYPSPAKSLMDDLPLLMQHFGNPRNIPTYPEMFVFNRFMREETPKHFGPYATGAIMKSIFDYFLGCIAEKQYLKNIAAKKSSLRFVPHLRRKVGCSEMFTHMLFPEALFPEAEYLHRYLPIVPDNMTLVDSINDVLSFYKESVVGGEENNYIMGYARREGCSPLEVVRDLCEQQEALKEDVRETMTGSDDAGDEALLVRCEAFWEGYTAWHVQQKRYCLEELLGEP
ncbi:terpenoid synthase [Wilcoxina mikolae CBS 423.85]|nr:terpenoid synthase [Wilcoxina mikolae CBS 423.85]